MLFNQSRIYFHILQIFYTISINLLSEVVEKVYQSHISGGLIDYIVELLIVHGNLFDICGFGAFLEGILYLAANAALGGSLKGIIQKLPYIADLGVDVIYLTPIFYSNS